MPRSVVRMGTVRCGSCQLPPRWCICAALPPLESPLPVEVLMHPRERWRPTSTGTLIGRVVRGARCHLASPDGDAGLRERLTEPPRELWILHPRGQPLESSGRPAPDPGRVRILLLDGSWTEAGSMLRTLEDWGRPVRLALEGPSRYWLRTQHSPGLYSTAEALGGLYRFFGLPDPARQLNLHLELLVYASLRARGRLPEAAAYLRDSPLPQAIPGFLEWLTERRRHGQPPPLPAAPGQVP